jgi:hypothetical protein
MCSDKKEAAIKSNKKRKARFFVLPVARRTLHITFHVVRILVSFSPKPRQV